MKFPTVGFSLSEIPHPLGFSLLCSDPTLGAFTGSWVPNGGVFTNHSGPTLGTPGGGYANQKIEWHISMLEGFYTPFGRPTWRISEHHGPNTRGSWFTIPEENIMYCSIIELSHRTIHESDFFYTRFGRDWYRRTYSYMNDVSSLVAVCVEERDTLFVNILKVFLFWYGVFIYCFLFL